MSGLTGKVAIVTGGSRGIGAAICRRLGKDGAAVIVNYAKQADAANEVVSAITDAGGQAFAVQADVSDLEQARRLVEATVTRFGGLDIVVNNAAVAEMRPLDAIDEAHFDSHFNLNVRGLLFLTQAAAKVMRDGGRIINLSSGAAQAAPAGMSVYSATKAAVETLTRSHAAELGARQITVNCVSPGVTETDMMHGMIPQEYQEQMKTSTALGRLGKPDDIADVVAFMASDEARWITGEVVRASGGLR